MNGLQALTFLLLLVNFEELGFSSLDLRDVEAIHLQSTENSTPAFAIALVSNATSQTVLYSDTFGMHPNSSSARITNSEKTTMLPPLLTSLVPFSPSASAPFVNLTRTSPLATARFVNLTWTSPLQIQFSDSSISTLSDPNEEKSGFEVHKYMEYPPCALVDAGLTHPVGATLCTTRSYTLYVTCYKNKNDVKFCDNNKPVNTSLSKDLFLNQIRRVHNDSRDYTAIYQLCAYTLLTLYGIWENETRLWPNSDGVAYHPLYGDALINVCLPIYKLFSECEENELFTRCVFGKIVTALIHAGCKVPVIQTSFFEAVLAISLAFGRFKVIQAVCKGNVKPVEDTIEGIKVLLIPPYDEFPVLPKHGYTGTWNRYWPCCYINYQAVWMQDPQTAGLSPEWSYLPVECRVGEITLMVFQGLVAFTGIIGNLIVLSVMITGGHRHEASGFLRTSLAMSDFLMSVFVSAPALFDSISIINDSILSTYSIKEASQNSMANMTEPMPYNRNKDLTKYYKDDPHFNSTAAVLETYYTYFSYSDGWFQVIRSHILCLSACVMVTMTFCLSVERLVLCWCPFRYKQLFTLPRVRRVILLAWIFGFVSLYVISYDSPYKAFWNAWTKIPIGFLRSDVLYNEPARVISIILTIPGLITIILSVLALIAFREEQKKVAKERESMDMRITDDFEKENLHISISLLILAVLYIVAYVPVGVIILTEYDQMLDTKHPIVLFFSWWFLLAGSAINPYVYNMRSRRFNSDLAELFQKILPASLKSKMKPYMTHSRNKTKNYLEDLDRIAAETGVPHDGLPQGSRLASLGFGFRPDDPKEEEESAV